MDPIPVKTAPPTVPTPDASYSARAILAGTLTKSSEALVAVISRALATDAMPQRVLLASPVAQKPTQPVIDTLDRIVDSILTGTDLSSEFSTIKRLVHAQDQRAELISQLAITQDFKRLTRAMRARETLEESIWALAENNDLLPTERILVLQMLEPLIRDTRKAISMQSTSIADIRSHLEKIDFATEMAGENLKKKFEKTSKQGREVVRKLAMNLVKRITDADKA